METFKKDKIGTKLWTCNSQSVACPQMVSYPALAAANVDKRSLIHRATREDVGIPLRQGQQGSVEQPRADTPLLFSQTSLQKRDPREWKKSYR